MPVMLYYVRELALSLPRSYEAIVRGRVKFSVGQIVYVAFSQDEETMGFGFPKEARRAGRVRAAEVPDAEPVGHALPMGGGPPGRDRCRRGIRELVLETPGGCACRSASPRSTPPRRDTGSNAETTRRLGTSPDRVPRPRSGASQSL